MPSSLTKSSFGGLEDRPVADLAAQAVLVQFLPPSLRALPAIVYLVDVAEPSAHKRVVIRTLRRGLPV